MELKGFDIDAERECLDFALQFDLAKDADVAWAREVGFKAEGGAAEGGFIEDVATGGVELNELAGIGINAGEMGKGLAVGLERGDGLVRVVGELNTCQADLLRAGRATSAATEG